MPGPTPLTLTLPKVLRTRADTNEDTVASLMTMLNEMRVHSGMKEYALPQESKIVVEDSVTGLMPSPQSTPALCSARVVAAFFRVDPSGDDYDYNGTALLQLVTDWQVQVKKTTSNVAVDDHLIVTLLQKVDAAGPADTPTALQRQIIQQFLLLHPTLLSDYFERSLDLRGYLVVVICARTRHHEPYYTSHH